MITNPLPKILSVHDLLATKHYHTMHGFLQSSQPKVQVTELYLFSILLTLADTIHLCMDIAAVVKAQSKTFQTARQMDYTNYSKSLTFG